MSKEVKANKKKQKNSALETSSIHAKEQEDSESYDVISEAR